MDSDPCVHGVEGGTDRRRLYAHDVGTAGPDVRRFASASVGFGVYIPDGPRSGLHLLHARRILRDGTLAGNAKPFLVDRLEWTASPANLWWPFRKLPRGGQGC